MVEVSLSLLRCLFSRSPTPVATWFSTSSLCFFFKKEESSRLEYGHCIVCPRRVQRRVILGTGSPDQYIGSLNLTSWDAETWHAGTHVWMADPLFWLQKSACESALDHTNRVREAWTAPWRDGKSQLTLKSWRRPRRSNSTSPTIPEPSRSIR